MNYLFRYLTTLKPMEIELARGLDMTSRERELLELLIELRHTPQATKQEVMDRLRMSGSMFDKSCSTLLNRLLLHIVPEGGWAVLQHLIERGVYDLFLHRLRGMQKDVVASGETGEMIRFYRQAFRLLHLRFSSNYPERLARQIGAAWRRLEPTVDTAVEVEALLVGAAIWMEAARRTGEATERKLERRLRMNDKRITPETGAYARYRQLKSWIAYYGQLGKNPEQRISYLNEALRLCEEFPESLTLEEKVKTLCQIAEDHYFYRTDHATPLAMYRDIFRQYAELLRDEDYHRFKLIQLCLITGEYEEAERILASHFGRRANMEVHAGGRAKNMALLWAKLRLLTGDYADARSHLEDAIVLNQKGFYLQMEIECRLLHTAICYLEGDFDLLERRIPAHLKFLRSKGITLTSARYYPWFFKLVGAFIDERTTGQKLTPQLERKLDEYMEGAAAQYGVMLRKMRGR